MVGLDQWPEAMLPVVVRHGPYKTYKTGLEVLGFPPDLVFSGRGRNFEIKQRSYEREKS